MPGTRDAYRHLDDGSTGDEGRDLGFITRAAVLLLELVGERHSALPFSLDSWAGRSNRQQAADPLSALHLGRRPSTAFQCPASVVSSCSVGAYLRILVIEGSRGPAARRTTGEGLPE
jgi:hypothetical protein